METAGMHWYGLVVGILCVWRLTHLLQAEDGPWDIVIRLRRRLGDGFWGRLLDCFQCLSLWIAAPFAYLLGDSAGWKLLLWPALSGGAILLQAIAERGGEPTPVFYHEDTGDDDRARR